jgi:hypothetical protein
MGFGSEGINFDQLSWFKVILRYEIVGHAYRSKPQIL